MEIELRASVKEVFTNETLNTIPQKKKNKFPLKLLLFILGTSTFLSIAPCCLTNDDHPL